MELSVEPRALESAARQLAAASRALVDACGWADATLTAGAVSLEAAAGSKVGAGWSQLRAAVLELATGYDRVGGTLAALSHVYVELEGSVVPPGGGAR